VDITDVDPLTHDKLTDYMQMDGIAIACLERLEINFPFLCETLASFKTHTEQTSSSVLP